MYIVDSFIDPEYRVWKKYSFVKKKFFDLLLKDSFKNADMVVTGSPNDANIVRKYRKDVKSIFQMVDYDTFTENIPKKQKNEKSFIFFSPQRFDPTKGHEILFKAIELAKSDFIVHQTDWGEGDYYEKMMKNKPTKVKIIPKIDRSEMPMHYNSSDALLGQVSYSVCGGTEREAIVCGLPVFCYVSYEYTENDPFCKSKEPTVIAEYLDKIVEDKGFRTNLKEKQLEWTKKTFDSKRIASEWNEVLHNVIENKNQKKRNPFYNLVLKLYFRR
jgi:glycosyltransferase involved in cell wall biosynthesis